MRTERRAITALMLAGTLSVAAPSALRAQASAGQAGAGQTGTAQPGASQQRMGPQDASPQMEAIKQAILRLPYYGPFDSISVGYDKGTVTLGGSAYALGLTRDAERAVARVPGVDKVVNQIEQLPPSRNDDELRWRVFYAIYTNDFLSRYTPGGGLLWGHRDFMRRDLQMGLEPIGSYPVHIIVRNGRVQLLGMVDSESEKTAANIAASGVFGSFSVQNDIQVHASS